MTIRNLVPWSSRRKSIPIKYEDEHPFSLLRRDVDELFDDFFRGFDMEPFSTRMKGFVPKVDVTETEKELRVSAELPGMDEEDLDLSINKDSLTIRGEKKSEREENGKDYYRMERTYGSFSRTIPIPVDFETEKAVAHFRKGVLTITLPKTAQSANEAKKIKVKVE